MFEFEGFLLMFDSLMLVLDYLMLIADSRRGGFYGYFWNLDSVSLVFEPGCWFCYCWALRLFSKFGWKG